jgi:hypothetical protein
MLTLQIRKDANKCVARYARDATTVASTTKRREHDMTFEVHANRKPWRFATEAEARAAANDIYSRKGIIVAITASDKPATHAYALGA